jgi:hypothetical protein
VQGHSGRKGRAGKTGKTGRHGKGGKNGHNGKNGTAGKPGPKGPAGGNGKKGPKGDSCKSELQVHLNALKSYVDMKFDVLKGMVDKTMSRAAAGGVVEESRDSKMRLSKMEKQLTESMVDYSRTQAA